MSKVSFGLSVEEYGQNLEIPTFNDERTEKRQRKLSPSPSAFTNSSFEKAPAFGLINFFTLRILIFDIGVALGDVISDFAQVSVTSSHLLCD